MTSVQTILHPTDLSHYANWAFQAACALARGCGAQIIVLHVLEPVRLSTKGLTVPHFGLPKKDRWAALHRLRIREADVLIEPVMRKGVPAEVILDVAREVPCDLIVMGVPGPSIERSFASEDMVAEVVRKAPCPVLTLTVPGALPPAVHH
jgi:nucleotide-binding universal stress UspA family protein